MKDWYQYQPWNLTHRVPLRKSMHMTYHTTVLLPNSCGPMTDGLFRDPKGQSYPHPKYWTHRWRIDINISHEILPIRVPLRKSMHITYHTTALLPNSCNIWGVDRTDPWGPEMDHPPLGRSYLVVVSLYDMSCVLILLTGLCGWDSTADIDINPSSKVQYLGCR